MLIVVLRSGSSPPRLAPPGALEEPFGGGAAPAAPLQGDFGPRPPLATPLAANGALAAQTDHLTLSTRPGSYGVEAAAALAGPLEDAVDYVQERTEMELRRPIEIVFDRRAEACGLDAIAYTDVRMVILYACPETPSRRAINVLAHELVHQLAQDRHGPAHLRADPILSEGLATWGAGRYWLGRESSFHDFVAANYAGRLLPLATDPGGDASIERLNQLYYQWAAYVEWLHATYGPGLLQELYASGTGRRPGSAAYAEVLGISFEDTEARWRAWLAQPVDLEGAR